MQTDRTALVILTRVSPVYIKHNNENENENQTKYQEHQEKQPTRKKRTDR